MRFDHLTHAVEFLDLFQKEKEYDKVFNIENTTQAFEDEVQFAGTGPMPEKTEGEAESIILNAKAKAESIKLEADAELYAKQQEAVGILAIKDAEAEGLNRLITAAGNTSNLNSYLLIRDGTLPVLAEKQAMALHDMKPKINIWNTGSNGSSASKILTDLFQTGMPLFDGIKAQTGYDFLKSVGKEEEVLESKTETKPVIKQGPFPKAFVKKS